MYHKNNSHFSTFNTTMSDTVKEQLFEEDNDLARSNCDKLYLDSTTADVNFVFGEGIDSVAAHKILLACVSTVFHRMFYGSLPEKGDIVIEDASRDAFKEFLQFFYLSKVRLSSEHIFQVVNLCKKYEMADALKRCEAPMQKSLKINNMCTGYSVALLLEMKNVIEFCEREIKEKPTEVLKSTNFLECDHKLLDKILQLVSSKCSASVIVDACMAWAKAECEHKNVRISPASLKTQLKDSLERIPFAELTKGQFAEFIAAYNGFFLKKDLEEIILEVMSKKAKANVPAPQPLYVLDCDRRLKNKAHI
ncbi:BTB/POZ domain-containing protein 3-like [Sitodiplosis mosellana]|uniref:BTB/POZ domain-containing protein 3-like n=1 Tax=Sitodiplosis mosellana TaxID=263140 RepID=UPI002443E780|nr:BTB/POZ domain-containing protein 3-like [Sitodiplosis mosellana]